MQFVIHCHDCSHGDFYCDNIQDDQKCPHCDSTPGSYSVDGVRYCWLHRLHLSGTYNVSALWLFTNWGWRGHESIFPNAKLYEVFGEELADGTGQFCVACQEVYDRWRTQRS